MGKKLEVVQDGYAFVCPGCDSTHVYDSRWTFNGNLLKPSFSPSMKSSNGGVCHFFVANGKIKFEPDSTHKYAGKSVDMYDVDAPTPDVPEGVTDIVAEPADLRAQAWIKKYADVRGCSLHDAGLAYTKINPYDTN